jgi:predicted phosphodiesterase
MRLLTISDIHGNYDALEAVLRHTHGEYDVLLVLGDLVGFGPAPELVIQKIRQLDALVVKGNWDDYVSDPGSFKRFVRLVRPSNPGVLPAKPAIPFELLEENLLWTRKRLSEEEIKYLKNLPQVLIVKYASKPGIHAFHASLDSLETGLPINLPQEVLAEKVGQGFVYNVYGHTHIPYVKEVGNSRYINVSSLGAPLDGNPLAGYSLIDLDKDEVFQHRIPYPIERNAQRITDLSVPGGKALLTLFQNAVPQG